MEPELNHYELSPEPSSSTPRATLSLARRKEANRLAAERSRVRRAERLMALEVAAQALAEENLGLKEQIQKVYAGRQNADPNRSVFEALISGQDNWDVEGLFGELAQAPATASRSGGETEQDRLGDLATAAAGAVAPPTAAPILATPLPPSCIHMHLNSDMEANLRQEIANKRLQLQQLPSPQNQPFNIPTAGSSVSVEETQAAVDEVNAQTKVLRSVVVALKADLEVLEKERRALKESLLQMESGVERDKVDLVLKSVRAHVVDHLGGATDNIAIPAPATFMPSSAPSASASPNQPGSSHRLRQPRTIAAAQGLSITSHDGTALTSQRRAHHGVDANDSSLEPEEASQPAPQRSHASQQAEDETDELEDDRPQGGSGLRPHAEPEQEHDAFLLSTLATQHEQANAHQSLDAATFASLLPENGVDVDVDVDQLQHRDSVPPEILPDASVLPDDFPQAGDPDSNPYESSHQPLSEANGKRSTPAGSCEICKRHETSVWRKLVHEGIEKRVCNACGLYFQKFGKVRPPSLWGDGRSVKKRRGPEPLPDGTPRVKRGRPAGSTKKTAQARALEFEQRRQAAEAAAAGVDVGMEIEQQLGDVFAQHAHAQARMDAQAREQEEREQDEEPSAGVGIGHELGVEGLGVS